MQQVSAGKAPDNHHSPGDPKTQKLELAQYAHEDKPHGFEAHVSMQDIEKSHEMRDGRVNVGRVKMFDETTGQFTWFVVCAVKKNGRPVLEITNIRREQDKITHCTGKWRNGELVEL